MEFRKRNVPFIVTVILLILISSGNSPVKACNQGYSPWGPLVYQECYDDDVCSAVHQNTLCEFDECDAVPECQLTAGFQAFCVLDYYCGNYPGCWNNHCS
jgi:hypothetical protein